MKNVSWPELCMLNCNSFAVVNYSIHMYLLLSMTVFSFHTFCPESPTYTNMHTYTHSMDPKVCQNKSEMWSKS